MSKLNEILFGWGNLVKDKFGVLNEEAKLMVQIRLKQCNSCSMRAGNICSTTRQTTHIVTEQLVKGCGCVIPAKILSPDSECPAGKW